MNTIKRIAIVGPECTGKSSLAKSLAQYYKTNWVPEFAREYLDQLDRPYTYEDLAKIAADQIKLEDLYARTANKILICDTTLIVIKIWSEFKYGKCDPSIIQEMARRNYDITLLTYVDIPWENDPQREHPDKRMELFNLYEQELRQQHIDFVRIEGDRGTRLNLAIPSINNLF